MSQLAKKLMQVILRDTGIEVSLPEVINRGYIRDGVFRWKCVEVTGTHRTFYSEDSMTKCVKRGVDQPRKSPTEWCLDVK